MVILGISAYYHDSAAALLKEGVVVAAAQEERFSRVKNDASFPRMALLYCLKEANVEPSDVDLIVFYDKPFLKFERILETFYREAPRGFQPFLKGIPVWIKEKLFFKRMIKEELRDIGFYYKERTRLLFTEHHLAHAASTFFASPFDEAAILTIDGVGEWTTLSIAHGKGNNIRVLKEMLFPESVGLFYSAFTYYLGFKVNGGEYKLMGLAPYGDRDDVMTVQFIKLIKKHLVKIHSDGSIALNHSYFNYQRGLTMTVDRKWEQLFGFPRRKSETKLTSKHTALAAAVQAVSEEIILGLVKEAARLIPASSLCLAGGVALNCVANGRIVRESGFSNLFIQPAAGDSGGALGAAWAAHYIYNGASRTPVLPDAMKGALLGPSFDGRYASALADRYGVPCSSFEESEELDLKIAQLLAEGKCIGWFQGRMEFGPRALGNRSILADPRHPQMQQRVNLKIKYRESFRPFAPAILKEDAAHYFTAPTESPYMLTTSYVADSFRRELPREYNLLPVMEKLSVCRSLFPAVTHIDFSARVQTVDKETNPRFRSLLVAFKKLTGCPMLINTSFNVRGEPIVCTPEDAYDCFMATEMDYLVIENVLFDKQQCKR